MTGTMATHLASNKGALRTLSLSMTALLLGVAVLAPMGASTADPIVCDGPGFWATGAGGGLIWVCCPATGGNIAGCSGSLSTPVPVLDRDLQVPFGVDVPVELPSQVTKTLSPLVSLVASAGGCWVGPILKLAVWANPCPLPR